MICIDDQNLIHQAMHTDGVYHVDVGQSEPRVKEVLLDGIKSPRVIFCDTNKGYLIKHKQAVDGNLIVENGDFIYEIIIGKVEVVKDVMEKQAN
ncbi:hypothetical protein [Acinetobacter sp. CS-2]|uniref:hypothetical protein n=1 Tax=Acinetobacter sp. CS-2 TaxID=2798861 RepID=UPI001904BD59|nr:hypothetical protein [Acinetobacter sp. CS-2]QQN40547.1 hypothetical protein JFY49_06515 [Acinetobacter sp. CS-2]